MVSFALAQALGATDRAVPESYPTIQQAIDAATDGDRVLVGPGTYSEQIDFLGKDIAVVSRMGPAQTILDGLAGAPIVSAIAAEPRTARLEGFTLTGADGSLDGGAIRIHSSVTVRGNLIRANAACVGAGIQVGGGGRPLIEANVIEDNVNTCTGAGAGGAAVYVFGAAVEVRGNTIRRNRTGASSTGAALFLNIGLDSVVSKNLIADNFAEGGYGGGLGFVNGTTALVEQNVFEGNRAGLFGGALYWLGAPVQAIFSNNTLVDNRALAGSALFLDSRTEGATLYNNLIAGPAGTSLIRCASTRLFQPLMFHNLLFAAGSPLVEGPCAERAESFGNFSADPLVGADYSLDAQSPAVDAGLADPPGVGATDFKGSPRVVDGDLDQVARVDIGALERQVSALEIPTLGAGGAAVLGALLAAAAFARVGGRRWEASGAEAVRQARKGETTSAH